MLKRVASLRFRATQFLLKKCREPLATILLQYKNLFFRFKMIVHSKDVRNPDNDDRLQLLENATHRQPYDGLNSLQTTITSVIRYPTHTRVKVGTSRADSRILPET